MPQRCNVHEPLHLHSRRVLHIAVPSLVLAALPVAAHANIVFPSVVQWLSAAGPYSFLLLPIVFTVPLLFAISTIEALIARAVLKTAARPVRLIAVLFAINAFTSAIGLVTMPNGTELLPGLPLAFLATTVLEGLCLVVLYPKGERRLNLALFKASALMNGASYALLGAILFSLIYLPSALMPNDLGKSELSGRFLVVDYQGRGEVAIKGSLGKAVRNPVHTASSARPTHRIAFLDGKRCLIRTADAKCVGIIPGGPYRDDWQIADNGMYYANRLVDSDVAVVGDVRENTQKRFRHVDQLSLCPRTGKVALLTADVLRVYDPSDGKTNHLRLYGVQRPYEDALAWSPDGRYIAHAAVISPFTQMVGEAHPDAIRVVSLDGREATAVRDLDSSIQWGQLLWLPE